MIVFLDSSALARRYFATEPGARRVRSLCARESGNELVLSEIAILEFGSAVARRTREGVLAPAKAAQLTGIFETHCATQYRFIPVDRPLLSAARAFLMKYPLRSLDAVHVAAFARLVSDDRIPRADLLFVTGDRRQASAADQEGWPRESL
jgi:predicted nucleic acid-binding protein